MHNQGRAQVRRLLAWFALNLVIFLACYLNYRIQLKHRYLYRILSIGLCLSRAAAMVINFNLLLVWMPMCKYTLTRLAVLASRSVGRQKLELSYLMVDEPPTNAPQDWQPVLLELHMGACGGARCEKPSPFGRQLASRLKRSAGEAMRRAKRLLCTLKIKFMSDFLVAVDHCTSLHTICATTITVASVVHTVAHLMNVINFSAKFDPLLGELNMAEYRGQNPLQLLVSVPGITGCLMILILFLMSLSSISIIRNSSYDLFQIFHRLSVLFVILLILHPSSHVLKEQSNVDRHHPDFCHDKVLRLFNEQSKVPAGLNNSSLSQEESVEDSARRALTAGTGDMLQQLQSSEGNRTMRPSLSWTSHNDATSSQIISMGDHRSGETIHLNYNQTRAATTTATTINDLNGRHRREILDRASENVSDFGDTSESLNRQSIPNPPHQFCLDQRPIFVAQSSICWYVLGAGLSCYLLDLLLRRLRRSRSPIHLLDACTDAEGNLIELVLSNNHRRFVHWLPGQFVYLNCPQIATHEWHPFTISSMDNDARQFTLHIKTGGDWTRKLRCELELRQQCQKDKELSVESFKDKENSMSLFYQQHHGDAHSYCCAPNADKTIPRHTADTGSFKEYLHLPIVSMCGKPNYSEIVNVVANLEDYDRNTGQLQVECKRVVRLAHQDNRHSAAVGREQGPMKYANDCTRIDLEAIHWEPKLYSICPPSYMMCRPLIGGNSNSSGTSSRCSLDLFIDGPFHSPFERLLEQQVSICIANGVGWTAFSSIFQQITNKLADSGDDWWSRWRNFRPARGQSRAIAARSPTSRTLQGCWPTETKLHLMVIMTTMEQFRPFYKIVKRYFEQIQDGSVNNDENFLQNPIQEITAFITRSAKCDSDVVEFCRKENLSLSNSSIQGYDQENGDADVLQINKTLVIRFGRPNFSMYLEQFDNLYANKRKISVYCCGSYQVKRVVEEICKNLNRSKQGHRLHPIFRYHEENF